MDVPAGPDAASLSIYEDTVEPCACARDRNPDPLRANEIPAFHPEKSPIWLPLDDCFWCKGSGYRLTKRIYRAKDFNEQAALAELRRKDAIIERAAKTLEQAALLFRKLGHGQEGLDTAKAASALREEAQ